MAIIIYPESDKRFSINNIQYLKNYVTAVHGAKIEIFNCYERSDVLVPLTHFSAFRVNDVTYPNALALQEALLPVLYSRSNLGGDGPDIELNNIDVIKYIQSTSANPESILALLNSLEMYRVDDKQSLWFIATMPGPATLTGRMTTPIIYKYKMVNYGKGTYGLDAYQLEVTDIELMYAATAGAADIAALPTTQAYGFGELGNTTIRTWLANRSPAINIQPQSDGYTIFEGTVNGVATTYLWLGTGGTHNTLGTLPVSSDFLMLGNIIPTTEQDNVDIKKNFQLQNRNYDVSVVLNLVNDFAPYTVNERQSVWFVGNEAPRRNTNLPIGDFTPASTNPLIVKYKMLNKGKGTYGSGHTQLVSADLELVYSNEADLNDLESVTSTQIVPFTLSAGQSVSQWLNTHAAAVIIQPQEEGYTIFKSTAADSELSYLWIGTNGSFGSGRLQSEPEDFQLLNETVSPVIQDNIDIKKTFIVPANYTTVGILQRLNSLDAYTVNETDSVWFTGIQLSPEYEKSVTNPTLYKYKMLNKGKGQYGQGGVQLTPADVEMLYAGEASREDIESVPGTVTIPVTLEEDQTIWEWLNLQDPAVNILPQEQGFTVFRDTTTGQLQSWLWLGEYGEYGDGTAEAEDGNFQLLNENIVPLKQDNIDIKKYFTITGNYTNNSILDSINDLAPYRISSIQSVWFVSRYRGALNGRPPVVLKYKMLNKGKGWYGRGGKVVGQDDIELVYTNEASITDIESAVATQVVPVTLTQGQLIYEWLNRQTVPVNLQLQSAGYTIFKDYTGDQEQSWLWLGGEGSYGAMHLQSTDTDFQILSDAAPLPFVPTLNQVIEAGNTINNTHINFENIVEKLTVSALGFDYKCGNQAINIRFENGIALQSILEYNIPAKGSNDVFAMLSDVNKPVKIIYINSESFERDTYLLQHEDMYKWLLFKIPFDFTIKIPQNIFFANTLIEGEIIDTGRATFTGGDDILLHYGASELPQTAEMNSVFGLKFRTDTDVSLFGKLKLL